jgi:murein L,D-transpeptidase YafK
MAAAAVADGSASPSSILTGGPAFANEMEGALVRAIVGLRETGLKQAMGEIDRALERHPNYKLGHMVKGDMLMARAGRPVAFASNAATTDDVAPLQDEARVRLHRYLDAPRVDDPPAPVLQLAPSQAHVLIVDTTRNRLFVYANDGGRPRYVTDFYISLGKNGVEKQRQGDQKTPLGVYRVISSKDRLPDFYGPGAFPLDYPNDWDRFNHRNGSGIWLHGTPSTTYSRAPRATDGCVVLTNEDFARLSGFVDVSRTPVVIDQTLEWREPKQWQAERDSVMAAFTRWKSDWETTDINRYFAHYSAAFRSETRDLASWKAQKRKVNAGKQWIKVGIKDMSVFAYPGAQNVVMITFEQDYRSNNLSNRTLKRQYWTREGNAWRIVHEAVL